MNSWDEPEISPLSELEDTRKDYRRGILHEKLFLFITFLGISFISICMIIGIITSIIHYNATTICVWLGSLGSPLIIFGLIAYFIHGEETIPNLRKKMRQAEARYERLLTKEMK